MSTPILTGSVAADVTNAFRPLMAKCPGIPHQIESFLTPVEPPPIAALSAKQWSVTRLANNHLHLTSVLAETPGTSETMLCNLLPWN